MANNKVHTISIKF